jgi:O-acetyl-ADP-ribose deacetylase
MTIEEKRKYYKCCDKYVTLENIETWNDFAIKNESLNQFRGNNEYTVNSDLNKKVSIFTGDITTLEIDSIVNAANRQLAGGGGVDGAIHKAANHDLLQSECRTLGGCDTGSCKITGGYQLPAKYIIHCVGPVGEKANLLASCYRSALQLMETHNLKSIAFPCISTGVYGYPNENAAHVVLSTVRQWLDSNPYSSKVDRIIFCLFLKIDIEIYQKLMYKYFPIN